MNYHLIRSVKSKSKLWGVELPALFLAVVTLFHFFFPSALGGFASKVALPLWGAERSIAEEFSAFLAYFSSKKTLQADVEKLSDELAHAHELLLDRDLLVQENEALKEQFGRTTKKNERIIGAILVAPPRSPYDTAILDIGEQNGVAVGDRVLAGSAVLGLVSKVYTHTSQVEFFSTAGRETPVGILHEGRAIPADAAGQGGGEFTATLPKETEVSVKDSVIMPGLSPLLFAVGESIETTATDSFAHVRFKNPVSIFSLRFLEVERTSVGE